MLIYKNNIKNSKIILRIFIGMIGVSAFFISPEFCKMYQDLCKAWEFLIHFDKVFHFMFFTALAFYIPWQPKFLKRLFIFICLVMLGAAIEIIQYYIPNRGASTHDFAADVLGVLFGTILRPHKTNKT